MGIVKVANGEETDKLKFWPFSNSEEGASNTKSFLNTLPVFNLWWIDGLANNAMNASVDTN